MIKQDKTSGFSILETLLVLVIAGILGFTGWFVWNAKQNTDQIFNAAAKTAATTATPGKKQTYLFIKDLGIKLPLTSTIKDLTYTYDAKAGGSTTSLNYLHFSTTSISSIPNSGSTCSADKDPLGTYTVYASRQANDGGNDNQVGTLESAANGHYIYYHHVQYACGDTSQHRAEVSALISPLLVAVQQARAN